MDKYEELTRLVEAMEEAQKHVNECEDDLKRAQKALRDLAEFKIPELMDELGVMSLTLTNGIKVDIKEDLRISIPKDRKAEAINWLISNGHGGLVKNKVLVEFGVGEEETAKDLAEVLTDQYENVQCDSDVNTNSVKSLLKTLLEEGEDVPLETFNAYRQRVTKTKR